MIHIIKSEKRGKSKIDWLDSYHSFSFGNYYDPDNVSFGPLRVLNHDIIAPSSGFPKHPHDNMEIITYIISGTLTHTDSMGSKENIVKNEVQMMTAGTGVFHSEYNYSEEESVELLQIWIIPEKQGLAPNYGQEKIPDGALKNNLFKIVSHTTSDGLLRINQQAEIFLSDLDETKEIEHAISFGKGVYIYLIDGEINVNDITLKKGDAAKILNEDLIKIRANLESKFMLFELIT